MNMIGQSIAHLPGSQLAPRPDSPSPDVTASRIDGEIPDDDWLDFEFEDYSAPLLTPDSSAYKLANGKVQEELNERLAQDDLKDNPAGLLKFVAKHTNPGWASFAWDNFVSALKECYEKKSLIPLFQMGFSLNCVHCTQAVDLTLHQMLSHGDTPAGSAQFIEAATGRPGSFTTAFHDVRGFSSRSHDGNYLNDLKESLKPGQLAAIAVPVTGVQGRYSHAMNMVNFGPSHQGAEDRFFIICGQSGRVFDLGNERDVSAFYARHTTDLPGDTENDVKFAITSGQQEKLTAIVQQESISRLPAIRADFT